MSTAGDHARHWRAESGQEVLEWSGLLIVIAAIFTMLFSLGMPGTLQRAVACALDKIFQIGTCAAEPAYPVNVSTKTVGYNGRVIIVDGGHSYVVTETHLSNGTAQISLVDSGTLGVSARAGAEVELGPLAGAEAQAQAGGGVYVNGSTTWTFPNWATADKYWKQISSGNSAGLAVNDTLDSIPLAGHFAAGLFDHITGARGAPTQHSIDGRYVTSTAVGGGAQGSASAGAGANVGSIGADIEASVKAQAGLQRINSGELKGDWQGTVRLSVDGDGSLGDALFGPHASGIGSPDGEATVTFGPDFTLRELEVTASGDGVWEATGDGGKPPAGSAHVGNSPPSAEGEGKGGEAGNTEPLLTLSHEGAGGHGVGSKFVGKLDLSQDPAAQSALERVLEGDPSQIPVLIADMNAHGTEYTQSYHLSRSNSTWGGEVNLGGGGGAELNDGSSSACYDPPRVRENGGPWTTASWNVSPAC